jgi:hypothetical protein
MHNDKLKDSNSMHNDLNVINRVKQMEYLIPIHGVQLQNLIL